MLVPGLVYGHEMVPTYPKLKTSNYPGVVQTDIELFNKRKDAEYYEIGVFDSEWNPIRFVSQYKILKLAYLERVKFKVYIPEKEKVKATYICSRSRLRKEKRPSTAISSMICSKFKK